MAHALLSPSSADRWIQCTPSALLESHEPRTSSVYADEGTLAHAFAALELGYLTGSITLQGYEKGMREIKTDKLYKPAMLEYIDMYVDHVRDRYAKMKAADPKATILIERRVNLSAWIPDTFGTSDVILVGAGSVCIVDLKYGQGVKVTAPGNSQLRMYALGAVAVARMFDDVETVYMCIIQPRMNSISEDSMKVVELERWANETLVPAAEKARAGIGDLVAGEHCGFCKVKPKCRAHADWQLQIARYNFLAAQFLEPDEIADIILRSKRFTDWLKAVKTYAMECYSNGETFPGLKVVEGRGRRYWANPDAAIAKLMELGYPHDEVTKTEILSLSGITSVVGRKRFDDLMGEYLVKRPGKPAFVGLDDPRPAINGALQDFKDLLNDDDE